jgi:alkyl hydroperoxide reductase subunit AhpF
VTVRRVLVLGASRSGISAALALAGLGLMVTLSLFGKMIWTPTGLLRTWW